MKKTLVLPVLCILFSVFILSSCDERTPDATTEPLVVTTSATSEATIVTEAPAPPIVIPETHTLSFVAAGDNMAYFGNVRDAKKNAEGTELTYDFTPSYVYIKPVIEQYDLAFINQETLMCGKGYELSYYPRFNVPQELGDAVVDAGFDIVGLANNHMLDKGEAGLLATLDYWEGKPVYLTGMYRNQEDFEKIQVVEKNGIRIAILSFTYGTNGIKLPQSSDVYVPYIDNDIVAKKVAEAEELCDITVVSIHWGNENTFTVNASQKETAKVIHENGGDIIIGHHPHCIQPIEWIGEGEDKTLCVYSLGNFMSEMAKDYNLLGGLISFNITKTGDEKATFEDVLFTPTVFDYTPSFYKNCIYFLSDYTDEQAKKHGISYYGNHTTRDTLVRYVTKTISAEFLPDWLKTE